MVRKYIELVFVFHANIKKTTKTLSFLPLFFLYIGLFCMELVLLFIIRARLEVLYPMVKKKVNQMNQKRYFSLPQSIAKLFHHRAGPRIANNSWF